MNENDADKELARSILSGFVGKKGALLMALLDIQYQLGYIPESVIEDSAEILGYSTPEVWGVLTFYSDFKLGKNAENVIDVCVDAPCHINGAQDNWKWLESALLIQNELGVKFELRKSSCPRLCPQAPAVAINREWHGQVDLDRLKELLETTVTNN